MHNSSIYVISDTGKKRVHLREYYVSYSLWYVCFLHVLLTQGRHIDIKDTQIFMLSLHLNGLLAIMCPLMFFLVGQTVLICVNTANFITQHFFLSVCTLLLQVQNISAVHASD